MIEEKKMFYKNGIVVQGIHEKNNNITNSQYQGLSAFHNYPLTSLTDIESRNLTQEQQFRKDENDMNEILEFISNQSLYQRYLKKCMTENISIRVLFVEINYAQEIWNGELPERNFLGYEYSPLPIDDQIATDLDWYSPFAHFRNRLNCNGLFQTYNEVLEFSQEYDKAFLQQEVGDGAFEAYICRIYEVKLN